MGIHVEGDLDLRNTTRRRRDAGELELAEEVVVLGARTLTLVDLDEHTGLVVGVRREDLGLLRRDGRVPLDERRHDTTSGLDTEGERSDIEEEQILGLLGGVAGKDGSLDSGTVRDGLVGVDRLVGLLAVEEVRHKLDNTGDTGGTTNENDLVDLGLVDLRVTEDLLDGLESGTEKILAQLLEASTREGSVEVDTLEKRVDFDGSLCSGREGTLGTLASSTETT